MLNCSRKLTSILSNPKTSSNPSEGPELCLKRHHRNAITMILISGFRREQGHSNTKGKYTKIHLQHNHCTQNKIKKHIFSIRPSIAKEQRTKNGNTDQTSLIFRGRSMRERSFTLIIVNSFNEAIFLALESFRVDPSNPGEGGREMIPYSRPKLSDL